MIPLINPHRRALSVAEYIAASNRIADGEQRAKVAKEYNIHREALRRALVSLNLPWQSREDNHGLTQRQRYVLEQMAAGRSRHDLATELDASPECISVTAFAARRKLGILWERPLPKLTRRQKVVLAMTHKQMGDAIIAERLAATQNAVRLVRRMARAKLREIASCAPSS